MIDALELEAGLGFAHYGVEVPAGAPGEAMHLLGLAVSTRRLFSVNPCGSPRSQIPESSDTRGVGPFATPTSGTSACAGRRMPR